MQFFNYYGGKQKLVKTIIPLIPNHSMYVEVFFGGGSVFFNKKPVEKEVINDANDLLINFYQLAKSNSSELQKYIDERLILSETLYKETNKIIKSPYNYNEIERAWAMWYNYNFSFCSILCGSFGHSNGNTHTKSVFNKFSQFSIICERLKYVEIFNRSANEVIKIKDKIGSFIYVDPPYFNSDITSYKMPYTEEDFIELLDILTNLKNAKFMLSSYPSDILSKYTKQNDWVQKEIKSLVSVTSYKDKQKEKTEVITMNYTSDIIKEQSFLLI